MVVVGQLIHADALLLQLFEALELGCLHCKTALEGRARSVKIVKLVRKVAQNPLLKASDLSCYLLILVKQLNIVPNIFSVLHYLELRLQAVRCFRLGLSFLQSGHRPLTQSVRHLLA